MRRYLVAALAASAFLIAPLAASAQKARGATTAPSTAPAPAPAPAAPAATPAKPRAARTPHEPTAGQMAARERQKKCGAEWREAKAAGKTGGLKWPQYWSQCNARLKGSHV